MVGQDPDLHPHAVKTFAVSYPGGALLVDADTKDEAVEFVREKMMLRPSDVLVACELSPDQVYECLQQGMGNLVAVRPATCGTTS